MPKCFKDVEFEFLSGTEHLSLRGTVIVRDHEMVLDIYCPDFTPYLIHGKSTGVFYSGRHEGVQDVRVDAKWTCLDDIYIGTWVEYGMDFVFKFRLEEE